MIKQYQEAINKEKNKEEEDRLKEEEEDERDNKLENYYYQNPTRLTLVTSNLIEIRNFCREKMIYRYDECSISYPIFDKQTQIKYIANVIQFSKEFMHKNDIDPKKVHFLLLSFFSNYISILSQISHPSIIKYIGYSTVDFENNNNPVIITEYYQKTTLSNLIKFEVDQKSIEKWNSTNKLIVIYGIASAMKHLHSHDIIHRDLKPKNVFLDVSLFPKLGGFRFSKFLNHEDDESSIKETDLIGTAPYISPEIWTERKYTKSSDVYAFGIIIYEIMSGSFAYSDMLNENIKNIVAYQKERPLFKKKIPKIYKELIESCWNKDPDQRPSFEEIVFKLRTNEEFFFEGVDSEFYRSYIEMIDNELKFTNETEKQSQIFTKEQQTFIYENIQKNIEENKKIEEEEKKNILDSLKIKQIELDEYDKIDEIGSGGFAKVYTIQNNLTGKIYAAKELIKKENELLFLRELKIHSEMNHPSIAKLVGYSLYDFKQRQKLVIVIEYIKNGSIERILKNERKGVPIDIWTNTMRLINIYGIALAIQYLHSKNILHLDIKPYNVLVDDFIFPKICDFGLSKKLNNGLKSVSNIEGTPSFMAPEIFKEKVSTKKTDVYAFGMLVYEMINKEYPFDGLSSAQIMSEVVFNNKKLLEIKENVPKIYKELIESCWNNDPDQRPSFEEIVLKLKTNEEFISEDIDSKLYHSYIEIIDDEVNAFKKRSETNKILIKKLQTVSLKKMQRILEKKKKNNENEKQNILLSLKAKQIDLNFFEIIDLIVSGLFGKVYKIRHKETGQIFTAITMISKENEPSFLRELIIHSEVNHPSITKLIGCSLFDFERKRKLVIVTECISNGSLERILQKERKGLKQEFWTNTMKLISIYGIASSIQYLHSKNILHLDINPGNVLVDNFIFPKLCNFGLSKKLNNGQKSVINIDGTPSFMAPEIFKEKVSTKKTDVYAFGMLVYEIINKEYPFDGLSYKQIIDKVANRKEKPVIKKTVPKIYKELIESCWNDDPDQRPSFEEIVLKLKTNEEFFSEDIDSKLYHSYIEIIDDELKGIDTTEKRNQIYQRINLNSIYDEYYNLLNVTTKQFYEEDFIKQSYLLPLIPLNIHSFVKKKFIDEGYCSKFYKIYQKRTYNSYIAKVFDFPYTRINHKQIFPQQVSLLSQISHPSIVKYIGYSPIDFENNNNPIIITEFCPNGTLGKTLEIENEGELIDNWNLTTKLITIYGIALAMSYLHSHNIIHRDLNVNHVFVDDLFYPKLGGFTFSQLLSDEETDIVGTASYIAPEVFTDRKYTKSSDVYSFGVFVNEILTGSNIEKQSKKSIPKIFQNLIELCLNKDPNQRPSFEEIVFKLRTNEEFIIEDIDSNLYRSYIEFIDDELNSINTTSKQREIFPTFDLNSIYDKYSLKTSNLSKTFIFMNPNTNLKFENLEKIKKIYEDSFSKIYKYRDKDEKQCFYSVTKSENCFSYITNENESEIKNEVEILSSLEHQAIEKFYGFVSITSKRKQIRINEYLSHKTLFDYLEESRKFKHSKVMTNTNKMKTIYGIASGLSYLHSHQIPHRQLNPKNIIVVAQPKYEVKLTEIGNYTLSKNSETISKTTSSCVLDISFYISPEQLNYDRKFNDKSDVYSYSLIVYEIITNKFAFPLADQKNPANLIFNIIENNYRPIFDKSIPKIYINLLEKCWSANPEERPSFDDILYELENNPEMIIEDTNIDEYFEYLKSIKQFH